MALFVEEIPQSPRIRSLSHALAALDLEENAEATLSRLEPGPLYDAALVHVQACRRWGNLARKYLSVQNDSDEVEMTHIGSATPTITPQGT